MIVAQPVSFQMSEAITTKRNQAGEVRNAIGFPPDALMMALINPSPGESIISSTPNMITQERKCGRYATV